MEIKGDNYNVWYDSNNASVNFTGTFRQSINECSAIFQLLNQVADKEPSMITLNIQQLQFINSSGIGMLAKFVIAIQKKKTLKMAIIASKTIPWHEKLLNNLQRLMPGLIIELL